MNIVALCKTFRGEEWLKPMFDSIAPFVSKVVFVNSEVSWTGIRGNTCIAEINKLMGDPAKAQKIVSLTKTTTDQDEQCTFGYEYIRQHFPCDYVLLIDTDEIWDNTNFNKALEFLKANPNHNVYRCRLHAYVKSPYYRVVPPDPLCPVVFIKPTISKLGLPARCCSLTPYVIMQDVYYHHYVHVRKSFNLVLEKIISSHNSENDQYADMAEWVPNVWNKLPNVENIHPALGRAHLWKSIKIITEAELPEVLQDPTLAIANQFRRKV